MTVVIEGLPYIETYEEAQKFKPELINWFDTTYKTKLTFVKKDKNEIYDIPTVDNIYSMMSRTKINVSVEKFFEMSNSNDINYLKKFDKDLMEYERYEFPEGKDVYVTRHLYKVGWPVAPREFVSLFVIEKKDDGSILFLQGSINTKRFEKYNKSHVRGYKRSGYYIYPDPENPNGCILDRLISIDPRGSIPSMVISSQKNADAERALEAKKFAESQFK